MEKVKTGGIEYLSAYMMIAITGLIMLFSYSAREIRHYQSLARDSIDSACLSAALINLDEYSKGRFIYISNCDKSFDVFLDTLKSNMNLNDDFTSSKTCIYDRVVVHDYTVYNIAEGILTSCSFKNGNPVYKSENYDKDEATPDGTPIVSSTVYADIGMNVRSLFGIERYVHVRTSVDVVNN